ncbi:Heterodimeric efflux ABC transporter, permease/ATP-binding subunit 1 [hydrothermal vent metagenome]|uniref:Heterodimeric efflux ABC transporter, permease/ATP-binding subunit 1 n=1 Tax=hydrothermal vent metagenome TaxID=652676 RepID=A0A3B0V4Y0_9ZZZZ
MAGKHSHKSISLSAAWQFIGPIFKRCRWRITAGIIALLAVDLCQLVIPRIIKWAVDGLRNHTIDGSQLRNYAALIMLLALAVAVLRFLWRYLILGFSRLLEQDIRDALFHHLLSLDSAFYQRRGPGQLIALATNDLTSVQMACGMGLIAAIDALLMSFAAISCMAYIDPRLTLLAVLPFPLLAITTRFLASRLHRHFKRVQEQFSLITEEARGAINNIRLLKIYTREAAQCAQFDIIGRSYIKHSLKVAKIQGVLFPASGFIANISLLIIVFFGGRMVISGAISIGSFVAFISYLFLLTWPMMALGWVSNLFQRGLTSLARIQEVMDERPVLRPVIAAGRKIGQPDIISFHHLTFTYPGQNRPRLKDITLDIRPGLLGIVGRTGSGKSTLCALLARLYPVERGQFFINKLDVNDIDLNSCRRLLSFVPQSAVLFSTTIAGNIAFGAPETTREEIEAAAGAAAIHDEIMAFPHGYETEIGERGVRLSGGQQQRIALARALLLRAPILLIDDALAAVDAEAEDRIMAHILAYAEENMVIMVTNRLSPLRRARQIAVLDNGRLTALGRHRELITVSEIYREIYAHQEFGNNNTENTGLQNSTAHTSNLTRRSYAA